MIPFLSGENPIGSPVRKIWGTSVAVSWTTHNLLLLDWDRYGTYAGTQETMNAALGSVLGAFGYPVMPFGSGGAWLVTGRRAQGTRAGQ